MSQRKRRHQTADHQGVDDEEETVDDLAVAASFAMAGLAGMAGGSGNTSQEEQDTSSDDDDESSGDDDDDDDESSKDEKEEGKDADNTYANEEKTPEEELPAKDNNINSTNGRNDDAKVDTDSDDESDVDLTEALARMVGESGDEAGASDDEGANGGRRRGARGSGRRGKQKAEPSSTAPLRTENEIDPYACPVSVLEEKLAIDLRVDASAGQANGEKADTKFTTNKATGGDNNLQLCPAGRVKNHLVKERTIVVESGLGMVTFASGPLDEGSLLVVRAGASTSGSGAEAAIIPLGRVFEVFGPVKQPLYTIRLLSPKDLVRKSPPKPQSAEKVGSTSAEAGDNTKKGDAADDNAIDLDEDGEEEQEQEKVANGDDANGDDTTAIPQEEKKDEDKDEDKKEEADPWAEDGLHTKLLRVHPNIEVYFVRDEAKLIDTNNVIKISGKGCDASNLYDEELNANEIDFSDDEEERMAKRKAKDRRIAKRNDGQQQRGGPGGRGGRGTGGRGGRGRNNGGGRGGRGGHSNFHHHQYQQPRPMAMAPPQPQMMGAPPMSYGNQYPQYGAQHPQQQMPYMQQGQPSMPMHPQGFQQMPYPQYQQNLPNMAPPPPPHQPYAGAGGYVVQAPQHYGTSMPGGVPPPPPPPPQAAYQAQPSNYPGYPPMQGQQMPPPYQMPHGQVQAAQMQHQQQQQQQGSDTVYYDYSAGN